MTNYDWLIGLPDRALALILGEEEGIQEMMECHGSRCGKHRDENDQRDCVSCILEWLRSERGEGKKTAD